MLSRQACQWRTRCSRWMRGPSLRPRPSQWTHTYRWAYITLHCTLIECKGEGMPTLQWHSAALEAVLLLPGAHCSLIVTCCLLCCSSATVCRADIVNDIDSLACLGRSYLFSTRSIHLHAIAFIACTLCTACRPLSFLRTCFNEVRAFH